MKVVQGFPPNIEAIRRVFDIGTRTVVFTYGDTLYAPGTTNIPDHLMAHEETHERQQAAMGVEEWWDKYLADPEFRLSQEVEAYQNQYIVMKNYDRKWRRMALRQISKDLSGPIYGRIVSRDEAEKLITNKEGVVK